MKPAAYLESVRNLLLTDSRITGHQIVREFGETQFCYIRARLTLADGSSLEFSEYIEQISEDESAISDYSYHWMDRDGKFLRRWDNALHYPDLDNFPHHIHEGGTGKVTPGVPTDIFAVLDEIAKSIGGYPPPTWNLALET